MEIPTGEYFEYQIGVGKWTEAEKLHWELLLAIYKELCSISEGLGGQSKEAKDLMGQYRIYSGGVKKSAPPPAILAS